MTDQQPLDPGLRVIPYKDVHYSGGLIRPSQELERVRCHPFSVWIPPVEGMIMWSGVVQRATRKHLPFFMCFESYDGIICRVPAQTRPIQVASKGHIEHRAGQDPWLARTFGNAAARGRRGRAQKYRDGESKDHPREHVADPKVTIQSVRWCARSAVHGEVGTTVALAFLSAVRCLRIRASAETGPGLLPATRHSLDQRLECPRHRGSEAIGGTRLL